MPSESFGRPTAVILGACLLLTARAAAATALAATANQREVFNALMEKYNKWRLDNDPSFARTLGIPGYDDKVGDYSIGVLDTRHEAASGMLQELLSIDPRQLLRSDQVNYKIINETLEIYTSGYAWKTHGAMNPVNNLEGIWTNVNTYLPSNPTTYEDFADFIQRIEGYGNQTIDFIARMKDSIRHKTTNHWVSVNKIPGYIDKLLGDTVTHSPLYKPFNETLEKSAISQQNKTKLRDLASTALDGFRNKFTILKTFISGEYRNATRQSIGVRSLPNGTEYYRACLRWHLTADMSPEDIRNKGLQEVERIKAEMKQVMVKQKFQGSVRDYYESLSNDPRFLLNTSEAVLAAYKEIVDDRVWPKLPKFFKNVPDNKVSVQAMPYDGLMAVYEAGDSDGSPGVFYVNLNNPRESPTYSMAALSLHEADPGHHLQDIYTKVSKNIPNYRKLVTYTDYSSVPLNFLFFTAYTEGWGLYAESLGEHDYLDVYKDEFELMGRYSLEMFRACRLVIDTGIHYFNWTRDQAIEYMMNHTSLSRHNVEVEIDRYITWPGQACAYKIGELKIIELRERARSKLGDAFDIRDFHGVLLNNGPVPLDTLEQLVDEWIEQKQDSLEKIMVDYFAWRNEYSVEFSTTNTYKYNDKLDTYSLEQLDRQWVGAKEFLDRLNRIDRSGIKDHSKQISYDVLRNMLTTFIDGYEWKNYGALNPIHFLSGLQTDPSGIWSYMPLNTQGDFINYVRRLEQIPVQIEQKINLTRVAISLGHAANNVSLTRIPGDIDAVLKKTNPNETDFYTPFTEHAEKLFPNEDNRNHIKNRLTTAITETLNKLKQLRTFIVEEYMPDTRPGLGVGTLPRGGDLYRAALKWHTDLDISPEAVHKTGRSEVDRISMQMKETMVSLGFPANMSVRDVYQNMTSDPQFLLKDGAEILDRYRQIIFERIRPVLPQYFRDIPDLPLVVQGSVADGIGGSYLDGSADGSRPGIFFANVHRVEDNPTFAMISLSLHEALPGHHLQNSYAKTSDVPDFRKYLEWLSYNVPYFFPFYNAYTEGWALYCEYLGEEMGIYHDKYELLGRYSDEMLRATRLVIDTGIHHYNWSREFAVQYMLNYTAMTKEATETEIDRYVTWPGQACGYKMGEIKIKQLRQKATQALGKRFDIRDFHYQVLANGNLPLNLLEEVIDNWIKSFDAAPSVPQTCGNISAAREVSISYCLLIIAVLSKWCMFS